MPRVDAVGRYCSAECRIEGQAHELSRLRGPLSPTWRGGREAGTKSHYVEKWRRLNPEKYKASRAVQAAIKRGELTRQPCERCGATADVHAHHDDYAKPLDVLWLCRDHHRERHAEIGRPMHRRVGQTDAALACRTGAA